MNKEVSLGEVMAKMLEYHLATMEKFKQIDERFKQVDERFDRMDQRFDRLEKRVDDNYVDLANRIDEVDLKVDLISAEQRTFRHEQQITNTKIDHRVARLENWASAPNPAKKAS